MRRPRKHIRHRIRVVSMYSCCACALIVVFLLSFHIEIPKMMWRHLLLNAWRCRMWWERSAALSNLYISTGRMIAFSRRNLVEVQILFFIPQDPAEQTESPRGLFNMGVHFCINAAVLLHETTQICKGIHD